LLEDAATLRWGRERERDVGWILRERRGFL
jgi:hypothetical protein